MVSKRNLLSEQTGHLFHSLCCFSFSIYISLYIFLYFKAVHTAYTFCCSLFLSSLLIPLCSLLWKTSQATVELAPTLSAASWGAYSYSISFVASLFSVLCCPTLVCTTCQLPLSSHHLLTFCEMCCNFSIWAEAPSLLNWYRHSRNDKIHTENHIQLQWSVLKV